MYETPHLSKEFGFDQPVAEQLGYELVVRVRRGATLIVISSDYGHVRCYAKYPNAAGQTVTEDLNAKVEMILREPLGSALSQEGRDMAEVLLQWDALLAKALTEDSDFRERLLI